jgi:hypothetical protein
MSGAWNGPAEALCVNRVPLIGTAAVTFALCSTLLMAAATRANSQPSNEQRALLTVRDVSGMKGAPIALGFQVQAPAREGMLVTIHVAKLPNGAELSDGSRTALATAEQGLVDVTGWNLSRTAVRMPSDGQFTLALVATVENGARPLVAEAAFIVAVGQDRPFVAGRARTVEAEVGTAQIAVRSIPEVREPGPTERVRDASVQEGSLPQAAAAPAAGSHDAVAHALAADRKVWLELERTRTDTLTRQLVAAHEQIGELKAKVGSAPDEPEFKDAEPSRLLAKANELIRPGDVSGARLLLERALETGHPEAAFYLAQTYDPRILRTWNVQGIAPEPEKARALYERAHVAGLSKAKDMIELMH